MKTEPNEAVKQLAQRILDMGYEDMPPRERHVIERVAKRLAVSRNINTDYESGQDVGGRLADHVRLSAAPGHSSLSSERR